jgi:hypothetical protein
MTKKNNPMLDESIAWIRNHSTATNHDIPVTLRDSWIYNRNDDSDTPGYQLAVFTYGLCTRRLAGKAGKEFSISASEIIHLFELWQMKLGLAEVNEKTEVKTKPLPLFDFPADEKVEYWYK